MTTHFHFTGLLSKYHRVEALIEAPNIVCSCLAGCWQPDHMASGDPDPDLPHERVAELAIDGRGAGQVQGTTYVINCKQARIEW